jgi:hypothetical protein
MTRSAPRQEGQFYSRKKSGSHKRQSSFAELTQNFLGADDGTPAQVSAMVVAGLDARDGDLYR